jgi:type I restriction enzyme M protein
MLSDNNYENNTKKETERKQLHKTIWQIANDLRGAVDGWDFKQYVLGFLFYRFISENITSHINNHEHAAGKTSFNYTELPDNKARELKTTVTSEKGFFILPSELFSNIQKRAAQNENLNTDLKKIFQNIESSAIGFDSEQDIKGLFDDVDVNNKKLGNTVNDINNKLNKILNAIANLELGDFQENTIDAFGDAYEYLMTMYASSAGKSGGEFYTPQEVSELLTKLTTIGVKEVNKVYDPACGSGSLLLKFAKILGKENVRNGFFGQEINLTTYNLARINMFLHDIPYNKFHIALGDTLTHPENKHRNEEPFDAIVSNPPYSKKWAGDSNPLLIDDERFSPAGVLAPKSRADLAFTMHILTWLSERGTAAIVEFPGVLYRSGAEQKIRQYLINENVVDCVIQLPNDLFFGTSIATCIIILKKSKSDNKTFFIDASEEFSRYDTKNKLTDKNITNIINLYKNRKDVEYKAKLIEKDEIAKEGYNLSVGTYITKKDTSEKINIQELNIQISQIVKRQTELRTEIDRIVQEIEK